MFWGTLTALTAYLLLHFALGVICLIIRNLRSSIPSYRHLAKRQTPADGHVKFTCGDAVASRLS